MDSREYRADDLRVAISAAVGAVDRQRLDACTTERKASRLVRPTDGVYGGRWEFEGGGRHQN